MYLISFTPTLASYVANLTLRIWENKKKKKAANSYSTPESSFPLQLATARGGEDASKQLANHFLQEAVLAQGKLEQQ